MFVASGTYILYSAQLCIELFSVLSYDHDLRSIFSLFNFSFEGLIFFVYDREAVKKEADPPENAIVYFYPPSV